MAEHIRTHRVPVTADHIARGERGEPDACPITLALREFVGEDGKPAFSRASTSAETLTAKPVSYNPWEPIDYRASEEIQAFVELFDAGKPVEPFTLKLLLTNKWGRAQKDQRG